MGPLSSISPAIACLDHVGLYARDMAHVQAQYERLGFYLTPLSQHASRDPVTGVEVRAGIANRCAMLRQGYLELVAIVDPALDPRGLAVGLQRYAGLHIVAFGTHDAPACASALRDQGFTASLSDLRRGVALGDDVQLARFTQVRTPSAEMPEGLIFALRHETPHLLWQAPYVTHPNGALGLEEVTIVVNDPWTEVAERYARYLGVAAEPDDTGVRLQLACGALRLITPAAFEQAFPGALLPVLPFPAAVVVGVADLAHTQALLARAGVPHQAQASQLVVDAEQAGGCTLVFRTATAALAAAASSSTPA